MVHNYGKANQARVRDRVCAPVIIPTLCRFDHFKRCIESLQANCLAPNTVVYIGLDYPARESQVEGYVAIREYLSSHEFNFRKLVVEERQRNYGAEANVNALFSLARKESDTFIITEDDNEFSPAFLSYINQGLQKYSEEESVLAILGYSYPMRWECGAANAFVEDFFFSAWGYGSWFKRIDRVREELDNHYYRSLIESKKARKHIRDGGKSCYIKFACMAHEDIGFNDTTLAFYMRDRGLRCIVPELSFVRNTGCDGSGLHCGDDHGYSFGQQSIYNDADFSLKVPETLVVDSRNRELADCFMSHELIPIEKAERILQVREFELNHPSAEALLSTMRQLKRKIRCSLNG